MLETVKNAVLWFVAHFGEIITAVLAIIGALEVIVKWTESPKDDIAVSKAKSWVNKINQIGIELISYITKFQGTK